ncbi:calcium/sodium antiporter [Candidatus Woesearchaeota archaeon]|nr:calcium/sodium antiporter [Candidatus Woesearchaeota archaeon]
MIDVFLSAVLTLVSIYLLAKGADYLVKGSVDTARMLRISPILVGLTIVAFGTGVPEFVLSVIATLQGRGDIAIGNIIGSNITNIGMIIGIAAIIQRLRVRSKTLMYEFPFLLVSTFIFLLLSHDFYIYGKNTTSLNYIDGIIMLVLFGLFLLYIYRSIKDDQKSVKTEFSKSLRHKNPVWKNIVLITGGSIALFIGGQLFIKYATEIAEVFTVSDAFIGLTIAAVGTSLPELFTTIIAARQKQADLAIGNIVGSNIFNVLFTIGVASIVSPINIKPPLIVIDGVVMLFFTLLFLLFATKDKIVMRGEGITLLLLYILYLVFVFWRM